MRLRHLGRAVRCPRRCRAWIQDGIPVANDFLNPDRALIFRITHRENVRWLLRHGLHCRHANVQDPNYVNIGNFDLIGKRDQHPVKHAMGGTLGDYVPFYFTPFLPMLYNIKTGRGVPMRPMEEIVILATSLHELRKRQIPFIFTDRHAYLATVQISSDLARLDWIDWQMLRDRNFARDTEHPERFDQYQAEALVYSYLPSDALLGVVCYTKDEEARVAGHAKDCGLNLKVACRPDWYV